MSADKVGYVIYLRNGPIIISKVRYSDWHAIQEDFDHYMTSLGPWTGDEIVSYFEAEYPEKASWVFSRQQILDFMDSNHHVLIEENVGLLDLKGKSTTALQFNAYINNHDLKGLSLLLTDDHTFIDSSNEVHQGKEVMVESWRDFFSSYPDYQNIFDHVTIHNGLTVMIGQSRCTYAPLNGPAIWTAKIREGLLSEWRVYLDTSENRLKLGIG
ncbi:MAG: nuclear transport factor 2 family protein [Candidatus Thorarchaeota archaeon]